MNIVLIFSSDGLTVKIIISFLLFLLFGIMTVKAIMELFNPTKPQVRTKLISTISAGLIFSCICGYMVLLEYNLLTNYIYVAGSTIEYCHIGKSSKGIEFEYYLKGKRYTNCNTHAPLNEIKVPGGKFKVRVSKFSPGLGRMDFEQPLTSDSKTTE